MSNNNIIGFDLDGVIIDFSERKRALAAQFGISLRPNETPSDIFKALIPPETLDKIQNLLYDDAKLASPSLLMPGAMATMEKLKELKNKFYLISRRRNLENAISALKGYGLWPRIFDEKNTFFVRHAEDKNEMAKKLGINFYFDDELGVLKKMSGVRHRFLFDQFGVFNKIADFPRILSWNNIETLIFSHPRE
jgi:uncharacterized HAD superfamily protein